MRHVSLYRKWRPRTFEAVAGQEPVVRTLRRAIETGRVAHAYLFSGPRGTGKTSTAKVLAMGLNCVGGPTAEPDGTCESCRAIINNSSMDVLEMDAASNRGIDEIRDLRDRVNLAPTQGRMKVYIIDEVHMLTTEAFNALLKMLEEPPEHVVFVLATTEKHKVLPTIISRCQSFDFRRPGVSTLSEKLREIADAEGIEAEPAALTLIAREGRGSFRDAEGLLDQLASFADGPITASRVRELLGSAGTEVLLETVDALYGRRAAESLRIVDRLSNEGRDLSRFTSELIAHLRRLMLLPHAPEVALAEVGDEERAGLEEQAGRVPTAEVMRMIEALDAALSRTRRGGDAKMELELSFLKLARDYTEPSVEVLLGRLEALEQAVANGAAASASPPREEETEPEPVGQTTAPGAAREAGEPVEEAPDGDAGVPEDAGVPGRPGGGDGERGGPDGPQELDALVAGWGQIMQELKARKQASAEAVFRAARPAGFHDNVLELEFSVEQEYYLDLAKSPKHAGELQKVLEERLGIRPHLELKVTGREGDVEISRDITSDGPPPARPAGRAPEVPEPEMSEPEVLEPVKSRGVEDGGAAGMVRSQQEVFAMARERFDSATRRPDRGS